MATFIEKQKQELEAFIRACAMSGKGVKEIALEAGLSPNYVRQAAKAMGLGIVRMRAPMPALSEKQREMLKMEASGLASRYGLSLKQLNSALMRELYPGKKRGTGAAQQTQNVGAAAL